MQRLATYISAERMLRYRWCEYVHFNCKYVHFHSHFSINLYMFFLNLPTIIRTRKLMLALAFPNLLVLNLASLNFPTPCDIPPGSSFKALETLDVSNTGVCDVEVRRIFSCMKELRELKLAGCRSISIPALSFLGRGKSKTNRLSTGGYGC
jgi:hypothetical protein